MFIHTYIHAIPIYLLPIYIFSGYRGKYRGKVMQEPIPRYPVVVKVTG